jgi:hypothetical protein
MCAAGSIRRPHDCDLFSRNKHLRHADERRDKYLLLALLFRAPALRTDAGHAGMDQAQAQPSPRGHQTREEQSVGRSRLVGQPNA